jgi:lipoprotein-anchoring transpeptidase ErfK/SrfK
MGDLLAPRRVVAATVLLLAAIAAPSVAGPMATESTPARSAMRAGSGLSPDLARPASLLALRRAAPGSADPEQPALRHLMVRITSDLPITARPGGGATIGVVPSGSKYYDVPTVAWVMERSPNGLFGLVTVPYSGRRAAGWIDLRGLERVHTGITVRASVSRHEVVVERFGRILFRLPAATGAPASPTPTGRYFVTDRIPFSFGGPLGSFAFGISGIQPNLPAGWTGGNQLAIHGTNDPGTIGTSASAGCLRVSEQALARLKPLLRLGTPVIITP